MTESEFNKLTDAVFARIEHAIDTSEPTLNAASMAR